MVVKRVFCGFVLLCAVLLGVELSAQTTQVISPATKNVLPGGTVTLGVMINNVTNLHSAQTVITVNNAILNSTSAANGSLLGTSGYSVFFYVTPQLPTTASSIIVDQAILGPGVVTGSGTLFTITFSAVGNGISSVTMSSIDLRDGNNNSISVTAQPGIVTVTNPPTIYVDRLYTPSNSGGHEFGFDAFTTVQSGVNAVNTGGTVNVANGAYNETVQVNKNLTLSSSSSTILQALTTSNDAAVSLGGTLQISGTLTLTSGIVTTGSGKIRITNSSPGAVAITSGSVNGEIERAIAAGSAGTYRFTDLNMLLVPDGTQGAIMVSVTSFPNTSPPHIVTGRAVNRYYTITPSGPLTATIRLSYLDAEINGIPEGDMTLFREDETIWVERGGSPSPDNNWVELAGVSTFSNWTIGDALNPLPIQLVSFNGSVLHDGNVQLMWVTLSEVNNYGFYLQRKRPSEQQYSEIPNSLVAGHGTTNEPHTYSFVDVAPGAGLWQYRLKQVDLNGATYFTEPIQIDVLTELHEGIQPTESLLKQNYPNPFNPSTKIEFALPATGYATLKVFNLLGEEVASLVDGLVTAGHHTTQWNAAAIPSGVYLYKLSANGFEEAKKLVLAK